MAKPNMPWSIKGVSYQAREAAKAAAAAEGLTIGAWLDQTILGAAIGQLADTESDRIAAGARSVESLGEDPVIAAIQRLSARVDATEQQATAATAPLQDLLERLVGRIEAIEASTPAPATRHRR